MKDKRYKPKSDALVLRKRLEEAWQKRYAEQVEHRQAELGESLATHLEALYPAADMEILAQYGCTKKLSTTYGATVRVYNPETDRWDQLFHIPLPKPVVVADTFYGISSGPRHSKSPNRGLSAKTLAEVKAGTHDYIKSWEEYCAKQDADELRMVPEKWDAYFSMLVTERRKYLRDYRECADFPKKYRQEHGEYPTWSQIEAEFPILAEAPAQA